MLKGDNTVGHWIRWCAVPISALRSLTGDDSIQSLAEGSRKSAKHLAIASRVVHQFRLLLRESGAMRHQISAPLTPMDTWIHNLVQRVQTELPLDLLMQHIRTQLASAALLMTRYSRAVTNPHFTFRVLLPSSSMLYS